MAALAEMIIVLTQGKFDNSSGNSFTINQGDNLLAGPPQISHGNNGNGACADQGPTTWCLDAKFVPGAFTAGNQFDFTIMTKPTDVTQLQSLSSIGRVPPVCHITIRVATSIPTGLLRVRKSSTWR